MQAGTPSSPVRSALLTALLLVAGWPVRPAGAVPFDAGGIGGAASGVVLEGLTEAMRVSLDDAPVQPDAVGFVPIAAGASHRLTVRAPAHVPLELRVTLAAREKRVVSVRLAREAAPDAEASAGAGARVEAVGARRAPLLEHWPSLTALGLSVAAVTTGVAFHVLAEQDWASLREAARDDDGAVVAFTEREAAARGDRARDRELGSWIGFGVGGGLLLTSAVLLVLEPFGEGGGVAVSPTPGGLLLTGTW